MSRWSNRLLLIPLMMLAGCASGPPFIDKMEPTALDMAKRRAAFELDCTSVTATMLSNETVQPLSIRWGYERAEYTIGVSGCNKRATYVLICPDNGSGTCFAGASRMEQQ